MGDVNRLARAIVVSSWDNIKFRPFVVDCGPDRNHQLVRSDIINRVVHVFYNSYNAADTYLLIKGVEGLLYMLTARVEANERRSSRSDRTWLPLIEHDRSYNKKSRRYDFHNSKTLI